MKIYDTEGLKKVCVQFERITYFNEHHATFRSLLTAWPRGVALAS